MLMYTSGTTGQPKGALHTQRSVAAAIDALHTAWGWTADDVLLHALPLFHVHGLFVAQHRSAAGRAPTAEVAATLRALRPALDAMARGDRATIFMGVPTFYRPAPDGPDPARRSLGLRAPVHQRLCGPPGVGSGHPPRLRGLPRGTEIVERYGMTETGITLSNPLQTPAQAGVRGPTAAGRPGSDPRIPSGTGR